MKTKDYRGITLIALIITIIVLLILAGVSISAVVGDNGVLSQSTNASVTTDIAQTKEEIEIALVGKYDKNGRYTIQDVIDSAYEVTGNYVNEASGIVLSVKNNYVDVSYLLEKACIVANNIMNNPTKYYGARVNYTVSDSNLQSSLDNENIYWRIFYADTNNIYLIASDYIPVIYAPKTKSGNSAVYSDEYPYSLYFSNIYSEYSGSNNITNTSLQQLNSIYWATNSSSTDSNMQMVAYLLDMDIWNIFANNAYADYAIGGPSLEMWINSWNAIYDNTLYYNNVNSYGYYVGTSDTEADDYISAATMSTYDGYNNTLYYPHQETYYNCYGYWLASPSAASGNVRGIYCGGTLWGFSRYDKCIAYRPIICLSENIKLNDTGDRIYSIID